MAFDFINTFRSQETGNGSLSHPKAGDRLSDIFHARLVSRGLPLESNAASRYFSSWPIATEASRKLSGHSCRRSRLICDAYLPNIHEAEFVPYPAGGARSTASHVR
jgi:hypothetical protein